MSSLLNALHIHGFLEQNGMEKSIWNLWKSDEFAKFFHKSPPWKKEFAQYPDENSSAIPLPHPGILRATRVKQRYMAHYSGASLHPLALKTVAPTSREFHELFIYILYRNMNISIHNYKISDGVRSWPHRSAHWRPTRSDENIVVSIVSCSRCRNTAPAFGPLLGLRIL